MLPTHDQRRLFGVGLSKTGNTSLVAALRLLGYDVVQANRRSQLHQHLAAVDSIAASLFRELDSAYPEAKFILTIRDYPGWLRSATVHYSRHPTQPIRDVMEARSNIGTVDVESLPLAYFSHNRNVVNHFADRPHKLLLLDICSGEGWPELCHFLGLPEPEVSFPHRNQTAYGRSFS